MTLRRFRAVLLSRTLHPIGRLAGLLMLVALVLAGTPMTTVHAHEASDGDHSHDAGTAHSNHASQHHGGPDPHDDPGTATDNWTPDTALHLHGVGTLVSTLPAVPALILLELKFATLHADPPATSAPTADRTPPHRPPIA